MRVQLILVPYDSAHRSLRMGSGPEHFLRNGIAEELRTQGHDVSVDIVEAAGAFRAEIRTAFELYRLVAERVEKARRQGSFPLVLSGNCSSCLGTIAGVGAAGLGIIWFDGHGDFNTPDPTLSGFLDGMGLAAAAGLCWNNLAGSIQGFKAIAAANILHLGGRDFDPQEKSLLDNSGVAVIKAEAIRGAGVKAALGPALDSLLQRVKRIYLHLDLDVLDPKDTPANEYAPPDGLMIEQVEEAIRMVGERFEVCAGCVASYDPTYDKEDRTLRAGVRIMNSILAATTTRSATPPSDLS